MHLAQFAGEGRRCDDIARLPTGDVVRLAKGADHERTSVELLVSQYARMLHVVVDQVFVDFIAEYVDVSIGDQLGQLIQILAGKQGTAGVMGRVEHDQTCAWRKGVRELLPIDGKIARVQLQMHAPATGQRHRGRVAVVAGVEDDDLVPWLHDSLDSAEDRLRRAGRNRHFMVGVHRDTVEPLDLDGHLLA